MDVNKASFQTMLLLLTAACGPKAAGDEHHEKTPDELLADACASFCERALACPLGDYAKTLDFQDQQTCVPQCVEFHSWFPSDPPEECLLIRTELWTCAGALETCELFDAFETTSFGAPHPSGNPCAHELDSFLAKCNG